MMNALSLDTRIRVADDVVYRDVDGEAVVLNLETGIYFGLDDVATRMWTLVAELGSLRQVQAQLADEFDAAAETLEGDLLAFVAELQAKGLLVAA